MKILFALPLLFLFSCSKDECQDCTRTWTYTSYELTSTGAHTGTKTFDGGYEKFVACGDAMIEAEEKTQTRYAKVAVPNYTNRWAVTEGTGTCDCN